MEFAREVEGKRITMLGLGLLGRGVGDAAFLAECGAQVLVTDKKTEAELAASVEALRKYSNITFQLGGHRREDFTSCDMVVKAAGVPLGSPEVAAARAAGVPVVMSTALFAREAMRAGAVVIGVTGTRGKSTTAHMIHHCLRSSSRDALLGGNVRGVSTLAMLPQVKEGTICVLELDSWQLQGFGDLRVSPQIAVFSNLMPDHQNYYASMEEYFSDKANIFRFQKPGDALVAGAEVFERVRAARPPAAPQIPPPLPADWTLRVPGEHNRANAALAAAAARALPGGERLSEEEIRAGLESFGGVEGRLQLVREVGGVQIYNDNNATTPEATIVGLKALAPHDGHRTPIILIAGGSEKQLPLEQLVSEIASRVSRVVLLSHPKYAGSARLAAALREAGMEPEEAPSLEAALAAALRGAEEGDIILFSPAFASFGMFNNEYERNDRFLDIVNGL